MLQVGHHVAHHFVHGLNQAAHHTCRLLLKTHNDNVMDTFTVNKRNRVVMADGRIEAQKNG